MKMNRALSLLLSSKGLPVDDMIAALWGKKIYDANEWQITTLTGSLPLSLLSKGEALTDYLLHGTSEGAGVETESGEPAGYKIPLSLTDGTSTSNYDLFIGDSKLYEDEYLDFGEQKIYRTILLTTHDNKDFITSDNNRFCIRRSNNA